MNQPGPDLAGIAAALRTERQRLKLTQTAFGQRFGLTQGQVSKLESGAMRELSAPVERALLRIIGRSLYKGTAPPVAARPMQGYPAMDTAESEIIFPLIRVALELIRSGKRSEAASLTVVGSAYLRGVQLMEHPEAQRALRASERRPASKPDHARSARRKER